jgi:hypothetical protein
VDVAYEMLSTGLFTGMTIYSQHENAKIPNVDGRFPHFHLRRDLARVEAGRAAVDKFSRPLLQ